MEIDLSTCLSQAVRNRDRSQPRTRNRNTIEATAIERPELDTDVTMDEDSFMLNTGARISRAIFVAVGGYQPPARRSLEVNANTQAIDDIRDIYDEALEYGGDISLLDLASVANGVIRPSAAIDKRSSIVNGWDTPRLSFVLELVRTYPGRSHVLYTYTGFTDHVGITEDGAVDPQMALHITSVIISTHSYDDRGFASTSGVSSEYNFLVDEIYYGDRSSTRPRGRENDEYVIDPSLTEAYLHVRNTFQDRDIHGNIIDPSMARISRNAHLINRQHNNPAQYLAKAFRARSTAAESDVLMGDVYGNQDSGRLAKIRSVLSSPERRKDILFSLYKEQGIGQTATLEWKDLAEFFPEIDEADGPVQVYFPDAMQARTATRGLEARISDAYSANYDADDWGAANVETVLATAVQHQIISLMTSEFIESISFHVTNEFVRKGDDKYAWEFGSNDRSRRDNRTAIIWFTRLPDAVAKNRLNSFKLKVERLILDPFSVYGQLPLSLSVNASVNGDIDISVSINSGDIRRFVVPVYCDAMTSPLITTGVDNFVTFSNNYGHVIDTITAE